MRCKHCGDNNPPENFFCGHCGSPLFHRRAPGEAPPRDLTLTDATLELSPVAPEPVEPQAATPTLDRSRVERSPAPASASTAPPVSRGLFSTPIAEGTLNGFSPPDAKHPPKIAGPALSLDRSESAEHRNELASRGEVPISGPSFLGLAGNTAGNGGDLDYLYEDEPSHSAARWIVAVAILAAFAVFLGYEWKQFPSWYSAIVKPLTGQQAQQAQTPPPANAPEDPGVANNPAATNPNNSGEGANQDNSKNTPANGAVTNGQQPPSNEQRPAQEPRAANAPPPAPAKTSADNDVPQSDADQDSNHAAKTSDVGNSDNNAEEPATQEPPPQKPSAVRQTESRDTEADQLLKQGQAYLYGNGVPKSCSQAVSYLDSAARMGSAKASSQLGGLYATGHCVPLDRARAYGYFTRAQDAEHGRNVYVQHNREMLWSQMTPAEKSRVREQMY